MNMACETLQEIGNKATSTFGGLGDIFTYLKSLARDELCANKESILAAAEAAIDAVLAIDIPALPNSIEAVLDGFLAGWAKARVRALIARLCPN